jgi:hypothetical protein
MIHKLTIQGTMALLDNSEEINKYNLDINTTGIWGRNVAWH